MSKLYSIIIIILVVGLISVGGVWLYDKIFFKTTDFDLTDLEETNINQQIPPEKKIPEVIPNARLTADTTSTEPIISETTATATTSTSAAEVDKNVKINILNGSGIPGWAKRLADTLAEAGWLNTATANADNFNYHNLTIRYKPNYSAQAEELKKLLSIDYAVINLEEKNNLAEQIEVVVGK